jgi:uncharacterized membrane protein
MTLHRPPLMQTATSTGLPPRAAAALSYAAWWITGLIVWFLEREDRFVRFHAAQAVTAFGGIAVLIGVFGVLAAMSLSFLPSAFVPFLWAAMLTWAGGLALWIVAMWKAANGNAWRIPLAADWADRINS